MREKIKSTLVIIVLFGLILVTFVWTPVPAWSRGIAPPTVRFTGTFYPPDTKDVNERWYSNPEGHHREKG
jgi:hypothetical protein